MSPRPVELPGSGFEPALALAREARFAEALRMVEVAIAGRDREAVATAAATALAEIGRLAEAQGDLHHAQRALEVATALRPRYPDLHHRLGVIEQARGRRADARRSFETALRLNPRFQAARLDLAMLDAREGLIGEALEALRALARETEVEDPGAFQQGLRRIERAEWEDAESLLRRGLALSNPELERQLERFREHLENGEAARAAALLDGLLPRYASYPDLHYLMGLAELRLAQYDDALASFARALELHPDFHEARLQLAQALDGVGESAAAEEQLDRVLEHDPANERAQELERAWSERGAGERRRRRVRRAAGE